ncbi:SAV_2336 N-terminal domain-related protein [Actinomadura monticuli]|uniref:Cholesterol oxidase n=1 Tax=Actinomadura monticuli TaxID=3097367 RepID=A0ABV4QN37_9ACTN
MASIEDLLTALETLGVRATDREISETLWLARHMGTAASTAEPVERRPVPRVRPEPAAEAAPPPAPVRQPAAPWPREHRVSLHPPAPVRGDAGAAQGRAVPARAPAVAALPHGLDVLRALRPLKRRVLAGHDLVLDEDATADRVADEKIVMPVLVPEPRRWLSLALVVDAGPAMAVWRSLVNELCTLLERLGAFHDIRLWYLRRAPGGGLGLHVGLGTGAAARSPKQIVDPSGRRLILVVSDCVDDIWRDGEALKVLDLWGRHGPLALLQPFPQRLWKRTGLSAVPVRLRSAEAGVPNLRLTVESRTRRAGTALGQGVPVPILEIEPEWLGPWARLLTGTAPGGVDGMVAWTRPAPRDDLHDGEGLTTVPVSGDRDASPVERVTAFRTASPQAYRLAGYLSAVPLTLPVMRMVQRLMLPDSRPSHLAEVFDSGLLHVVGEPAAAPEETRYAFDEGVAEVLQGTLRRSEAVQIVEEVNAFITARLGQSRTTGALLTLPDGSGDQELASSNKPFAAFSAEFLQRLGGDYAELAASSPPRDHEPVTSASPRSGGKPSSQGWVRAPRSSIEHVDAVVVGSGFGGSVAAFRLAEAGQSVVVLERGRPYPPGAFPRSPAEMGRAFWDPSAGLYGMYDVWNFRGCDSIVTAGLGGGSLIYANVLLRKDERWFVNDRPSGGYDPWPVTRADLDPHYDAVERMLGATPYPLGAPPFDDTPKAHGMRDAAAELGLEHFLPPLAVSFAPEPGGRPGPGLPIIDPEYGNIHGVPRRTCRLKGACNIGCNEGAKNTLDHTYLSAAAYHAADIRTSHEVKAIRPRPGGGYEVDYVHHDDLEAKSRRRPVVTISCDRLILGAGTYGTTFLLLRSRREFPGLSEALGTRFNGNGDLLTFLMRATDRNRVRPLNASRGPVVTSAIRLPDELDGASTAGRGAYIQDGGYPAFADWIVDGFDVGNDLERAVKFLWDRFTALFREAPDTNLSKEISDLIGDGALTVSSLPLLGMGRDTADGRLRLKDGRLAADWTADTSEELFNRVRKTMRGIADVLGADYADNPMWFRKRIITIHPLGGAPMGAHPGEGVCDAFGEVFGHPGLYIADGAAMPGPVGANPALTIAAHADRMSTQILDKSRVLTRRPSVEKNRRDMREPQPPRSGRTSLSFVEEMKGFITYGISNPRAGEIADERRYLAFRLTITADDVMRFLDDPSYQARAEGWIDIGRRWPVERGTYHVRGPSEKDPRRLMGYRLHFNHDGRPRTLAGHKDVPLGQPTRIWPETSTLYVRILEGHVSEEEEDAPVVGAGVLHIRLTDFARTLTTFRCTGPDGATALPRIGRHLFGDLFEVYGPSRA